MHWHHQIVRLQCVWLQCARCGCKCPNQTEVQGATHWLGDPHPCQETDLDKTQSHRSPTGLQLRLQLPQVTKRAFLASGVSHWAGQATTVIVVSGPLGVPPSPQHSCPTLRRLSSPNAHSAAAQARQHVRQRCPRVSLEHCCQTGCILVRKQPTLKAQCGSGGAQRGVSIQTCGTIARLQGPWQRRRHLTWDSQHVGRARGGPPGRLFCIKQL